MNIKNHMEIILEALQDYRKWFEDDPDKQQEIDSALASFNQNSGSEPDKDHNHNYYPITSVCRADIIEAFENDANVKKVVMNLKDHEMKHLASKMADDYCNQLFWDSLRVIFEERFIIPMEEENNVE